VALVVTSVAVDESTLLWTASAPWIWPGFRSVTLSASEVSFVLLAAYGFLTDERGTVRRLGPGGRLARVAGVVLLGCTALSGITAIAPLLSIGRFIEIAAGLLAFRTLAARPGLARRVVAGLGCAVVVQLPLALLQEATQSTFPMGTWFYRMPQELPAAASGAAVAFGPDGLRWQRAMGSFLHPNILGGFLAASLVLGLVARRPARTPGAAFLGVWVVGWIELGLTLSRAAILAAALGFLVYGLGELGSPRGRRTVGLLLGGVVCGGLVAAALTGPILVHWLAPGRSVLASPSATQRVLVDGIGVTLIREHPLLGVGAGNFSLATLRPPIDAAMVDPAHAVPVLVAAESGVAAGVAWLILVVSPLGFHRDRRGIDGAPPWRAAPVVGAILVLSMLDHYLWTLAAGQATFWLSLGVAAAGPGEQETRA
jgi:hypothetical protein